MNWEEVSIRLKKLREDKGLSHQKLAEELTKKYGNKNVKSMKILSKQVLINYEVNDKSHINFGKVKGMSVETLCMLADFYEVSIDYILKGDNVEFEEALKDDFNKLQEAFNHVIKTAKKISFHN